MVLEKLWEECDEVDEKNNTTINMFYEIMRQVPDRKKRDEIECDTQCRRRKAIWAFH